MRGVFVLFLVTLGAVTQVSLAEEFSKTLQRPIFSNTKIEDSFQLYYRLHSVKGQPWNPWAPTIVFLQGGPGLSALNLGRPKFIPARYQVILIDPRGTGLSQLPASRALDQMTSSSEFLAEDVMAVVRAEGLKQYIFWGHSFGTVVATIAASRLEDSGGPQPKSIILEGTLGRSFHMNSKGEHEVDIGIREALDGAYNQLTAQDRTLLQTRLAELRSQPEGLELVRTLVNSEAPKGLYPLLYALVYLARTPSTLQAYSELKDWSKKIDRADANFEQQMLNIGCTEIVADLESVPVALATLGGTFQVEDMFAEGCRSSTKKKTYYDSSNFTIRRSPLFYFSGSNDPKTPLWQAEYHRAQMQKANGRIRFTVLTTLGHMPLQYALPNCREHVLAAAFSGDVTVDFSFCMGSANF